MRRTAMLVVIGLLGLTSLVSLAQVAQFREGDAVEAMRGSNWEPATVVRIDGALVMVRFKDSKTLFCVPEKVRARSTSAPKPPGKSPEKAPGKAPEKTPAKAPEKAPADAPLAPPADKPVDPPSATSEAPAAPSAPAEAAPGSQFRIGDKVEFCDDLLWQPGKMLDRKNGWLFVVPEDRLRGGGLWLEPWRVRVPGTKEPFSFGSARLTDRESRTDPRRPPKNPPGPLPDSPGNSRPTESRPAELPWQSVVDPAPAQNPLASATALFLRDADINSLSRAKFDVIGDLATFALVDKTLFVGRYDLAKNQPAGSKQITGIRSPIAITAAGDVVAACGDARTTGDGLILIPADGKDSVTFAGSAQSFLPVDAEHTIVLGNPTFMIRNSDGKQVWRAPEPINDGSLTPGGKYILTPEYLHTRLSIYSTANGKRVGILSLPRPSSSPRLPVCTPDGTRVIVSTNEGAHIFDAATGKLLRTLPLCGTAIPVHVLNNQLVMLDGRVLELETGRVIWKYEIPNNLTISITPRGVMMLDKTPENKVRFVTLPPLPHALALANPLKRAPIFEAGSRINIFMDVEADDQVKQSCIKALKEKIVRAGHTYDPLSSLAISVRTERMPERSETYDLIEKQSRFEFRGKKIGTAQITHRPIKTTVAFLRDGERFETQEVVRGGYISSYNEDESPQQAADRASHFDSEMVNRFAVPPVLIPDSWLGKTEVTPDGLKEKPAK